MQRLEHLRRFYEVLSVLERRVGGRRFLSQCDGRMSWPSRGVYFFFEEGEVRTGSGSGPRVVRVGTHALKNGSRTKLWTRLCQHRGPKRTRGGNHRGSVFREIVGQAIMSAHPSAHCGSWGSGKSASKTVRDSERLLEGLVSGECVSRGWHDSGSQMSRASDPYLIDVMNTFVNFGWLPRKLTFTIACQNNGSPNRAWVLGTWKVNSMRGS